jgi:hypothetical protein
MSRALTVSLVVCLLAGCSTLPALANLFDGRWQDAMPVVLGVRARILTGGLPNLHGGAASCVWAMVCDDDYWRYAQAGYARWSGETTLKRFAQWTDVNGVPDEKRGAAPRGMPTYECIQDATTGKWTFSYNGTEFADSGDDDCRWAGGVLVFCGEVTGAAVQMMGESDHKVVFSGFERYVSTCGGDLWQNMWPGGDPPINDRPLDWGQDVSQANGWFKIWDTTP